MASVSDQELAHLRPIQAVGFERDPETGRVILLKPRYQNRLLLRLLAANRPYVKIHLDDLGSAVWSLANSQLRVSEIVATLVESHPEEKKLKERALHYLRQLAGTGLIRLVRGQDASENP